MRLPKFLRRDDDPPLFGRVRILQPSDRPFVDFMTIWPQLANDGEPDEKPHL